MISFWRRAVINPGHEEYHLDTVAPFRAWRYSKLAGELSGLVAPPYDVVGPEQQTALYGRSPYNVVRVDLGVNDSADTLSENRYTRAAALVEEWKSSGILVRDEVPTVTFVEEAFTGPDGQSGLRHGVLAGMRLSPFGEGVVFPHEQTLTGPKEDRYRLMSATAMSLSPVFLLYDLPGDEITAAWATSLSSKTPTATTIDDRAGLTRLWATSDPALLDLVTNTLRGSRFLVADGHHRYETALRYQSDRGPTVRVPEGSTRGSDYCLVYLANMRDPALTIYPTHRLLKGLDESAVANLPQALAGAFKVERLWEARPQYYGGDSGDTSDAKSARSAIERFLLDHARGAFGLWGPCLEAPYGILLADVKTAHVSSEHSEAYQELDVAVLQDLILSRALGISPEDVAAERHVTFFKDTAEAFARLQGGDFQLGFFMNPTGLEQVCQVAFGGERMPQKTTFFYPKLPTGLVFHDLAGAL